MALTNKEIYTSRFIAFRWATITIKRWQERIKKLKIDDSGDLMSSFIKEVVHDAGDDQIKIRMAFKMYGRFVDMGVGKGAGIGNVRQNATSRRLEGKMIGNKRRPKKWYSKTMKAETLRLIEILAQNFGKSAIDAIQEGFVTTIEHGK